MYEFLFGQNTYQNCLNIIIYVNSTKSHAIDLLIKRICKLNLESLGYLGHERYDW